MQNLYAQPDGKRNRTDTDRINHHFPTIAKKYFREFRKYCGQITTDNDKKAKPM